MIARPIQRARVLLSLFLCLASPGRGQLNTATVLGVVQDSTKSSIPEAKLKLINTQTGSENDTTTNAEGSFLLPAVIPGSYTLQIERAGFATTQLTGLLLSVGDTRNLLIRMKVGSVAESVTVDASGLTLNTTDGSVSTVVDRRFVTNVPLNGRSFQDLISMTPGIVPRSPQAAAEGAGTQGGFSVNGQQPQSNSFFVDGVSANVNSGLTSGNSRLAGTGSVAGTTALGTTQSLVSVDALQEFRVLSSTYSAEYGRTPGGQFTFLTRSGTSKVHGTLYDYVRHNSLDAVDWFAGSRGGGHYSPTNYNQNDFGGTLGAPLVVPRLYKRDDKTFVFFSYEGLYLAQPTPQTYVYTPNYQVTQESPPALIPLWKTFPLGSAIFSQTPPGLVETVLQDYVLPAHVNSTSLRMDRTFSPRFSFFVRYADTPSYSQTRQLESVTAEQVNLHSFTFGSALQLSASRSNDFRLGYTGNNSTADTEIDILDGFHALENLNGALGIGSFAGPKEARVYIRLDGIGDSESYRGQSRAHFHDWNVRDNFNLQAGNHLFKFGIDQRRIVSTENPPPLSVQADFFDLQSMVANSASYVVVTRSNQASPHLNEFSAFVQDEWRLSQSFTLSLGLRWEINPAPYGSRGAEPYAVRGDVQTPSTLQLDPRGTPLWRTSWFNLAPRFGAAWLVDPQPGKELIVRAGGGIFYDTGNQPALRAFQGLGFKQSMHYSNVPLPATPTQINFSPSLAPPYRNSESFVFPQHLQLPYSLQWNIGIEKAFGKNQTATISYVGANGHRLLQEQRRNVSTLNPAFGDVSYFPNGVTSNYEALQAKFQRALGHGLEGLASYTFAHMFDYGSTDPAFSLTYGTSDLDVRHNVEAALSWDLPKPVGNRLVRWLVGNWQVNGRVIARTGFPVTPEGNFFFDPITGNPYYSGTNLAPGKPLYQHGSEYPGHRGFNGGSAAMDPAFSLPDGTAEGNAPRNLLRGFGAAQINIAARREFALHDNLHLQVEGATFNIFNHPNFGYIDPYLNDALFGQATKQLNESYGNSGALYQQGGPRSTQFSVKFVF